MTNYSSASPDSVFCKNCCQPFVSSLAYQYRYNLDTSELPDEVTSRRNCYWGKACRTQTHNANHMKNYNHICEQVSKLVNILSLLTNFFNRHDSKFRRKKKL